MVTRPRVLVAWSSGKDSAWALHEIQHAGGCEVAGLFTTFNEASQRVPHHEVRMEILALQANSVGLPLAALPLPHYCPNTEYESRMRSMLEVARAKDITAIAYGDLHLQDIRQYREQLHHGSSVTALFPLWERNTTELAQTMTSSGLEAIITCVDTAKLPADLIGRKFDASLLSDLPADVDPCGEHGEFHTCVIAGPMFREPLKLHHAAVQQRGSYCFCDLMPAEPNAAPAPVFELSG